MSRRAGLLIAGLVVLLVVVLVVLEPRLRAPAGETPGGVPTVYSAQAGGTRALALWLDALGYRVVFLEGRPFAVDDAIELLFVLEPRDLTEAHADAIVGWVERGGTLVLADRRPNALASRLGADVVPAEPGHPEATPLQPGLLGDVRRVETTAKAQLTLRGGAWVPVLGSAEGRHEVAAVAAHGAGRVHLLAASHPLSNAGIGRADNARLLLHMLRGLPAGATVAFDEYHHGLTEHGTLGRRLFGEPWGWALLYAVATTFLFLVLAGRRFGPARPDRAERPPRGRGEYVATLAEALRESGQSAWLRRAYVEQAKRRLGRRFRIAAGMPTAAFVATLAARRPEAAALAEPLARLESGGRLGDAALVDLLRRADAARAALEAR